MIPLAWRGMGGMTGGADGGGGERMGGGGGSGCAYARVVAGASACPPRELLVEYPMCRL